MSAKNKGTLCISSKVVEVSEEKDYLELVNRVCYYNAPNLNGVEIQYDDSTLEKAKTLINKPVVAKYVVDKDGKPTFKGHEVVRNRKGGYKFGTQAIGTHTDVEIREDDVELPDGSVRKMPCLFAKQMIWKRFENAVAAIKRLFDEDRLHNSWEISTFKYTVDDGIKYLEDYAFIGNCFLGLAQPAYGNSAKVLSVAEMNETEFEDENTDVLLVAQALTEDMIAVDAANSTQKECGKEENIMVELETMIESSDQTLEQEDTAEVISENETSEASSLAEENENCAESSNEEEIASEPTMQDIYHMIGEAMRAMNFYPSIIFPESHTLLAKNYTMPELCFVQYDYAIENGKAILSNERAVELVVSPININAEIEKKNNAIIEAQNEVNRLEAENAELKKAKTELDAIHEKIEQAEKQKAIAELTEYVRNSKCFSEDEMKSDEFCAHFDVLDKAWFKNEIADRIVSDRMKDKPKQQKEKFNDISMVLGNDKELVVTASEVMSAFFKR